MTSVRSPASEAISGATASRLCGFTASTSASGGASPAIVGLSAAPRALANAAISCDGRGSRMTSDDAARPPSSQPEAIAPPIFPAPTRTRRAGHRVVFISSFSGVITQN